jgi:hypothetical protein
MNTRNCTILYAILVGGFTDGVRSAGSHGEQD